MLFLYQDSFGNIGCDTRLWLSYGLWLVIGLGASIFLLISYVRASPLGWQRTVFAWGAGLFVLFVPMFAVVPALSEKTALVFVEGSDFVRSGCRGSHAFTKRYPLHDIRTSFQHTASRGGEHFTLRIHWTGQSRKFGLGLHWDDPLMTNLAAFAPRPIDEYAAALRERKIDVPWASTAPRTGIEASGNVALPLQKVISRG